MGKTFEALEPSPLVTGAQGWARLGLAIVKQAVYEARDGNQSALAYLEGDQCRFYLQVAGFDSEAGYRLAKELRAGVKISLPNADTKTYEKMRVGGKKHEYKK